jgi:hypothetical protein
LEEATYYESSLLAYDAVSIAQVSYSEEGVIKTIDDWSYGKREEE